MTNNLIEQFKENAKIHFDIDYTDMRSVRRGNKAAYKLFELAEKLKDHNQINEFAELLHDNHHKVDLWTAHILLERVKVKDVLAEKALEIIRLYANAEDVNAYGEKFWLQEWSKRCAQQKK
ncbi:MAG: hypothetical protein INR73_07010 [Williamsia sp.]|nr:hypothetical protein [Williamsia sp.]